MKNNKSPSDYCKSQGLKSLQQCSELSGFPVSTLRDMHRNDFKRFKCVVAGCVVIDNEPDKE